MQWYIPITIIPGIGLIIMSTSTLLIALNTEVSALNRKREIFGEMIAGVTSSLVAIVYLISFGFRSVHIRQKHLFMSSSDFDY